jgi:hypothetical protein
MSQITASLAVAAIVRRNQGVTWIDSSKGLALVRSHDGHALVAEPGPKDEVLGKRLIMPREDGQHMPHGHVLTPQELERAVRIILGL